MGRPAPPAPTLGREGQVFPWGRGSRRGRGREVAGEAGAQAPAQQPGPPGSAPIRAGTAPLVPGRAAQPGLRAGWRAGLGDPSRILIPIYLCSFSCDIKGATICSRLPG